MLLIDHPCLPNMAYTRLRYMKVLHANEHPKLLSVFSSVVYMATSRGHQVMPFYRINELASPDGTVWELPATSM